jgi:sorbitol-specific phosphotransferase system component IIC
MTEENKINKTLSFLKVLIFLLAAIGIVMVTRRLLNLSGFLPSNNKPGYASLDQGFDQHTFTTILHIVPAALFMISGLLQFMPSIHCGIFNCIDGVKGYLYWLLTSSVLLQ